MYMEGRGKGGGEVGHKINGLCGLEPGKVKLFSICAPKEENYLRWGGGGTWTQAQINIYI